ncbi:precorrin-2 C(20)-methyltransferase [Methylotuvimicrobium buryatense]|uniref:Precorrin-2 C(20)-methyltransferase n=1 Tax=Methylotuvimicrobium buryatense TaxID=95641 RepID=A0A4P9URC7_METBY|nr:precorrin-2 C(20)-methyltransferase [Methylotuvimicrobium buryatense]QCW82891.1 precorrin-2 C(20)-methyltransferase [Methylotuvimicrobium buryatense]
MNNKLGTLYGISLGPGDPGLITRRAWDLLSGPGHWAYPVRKKNSDSYALDIALRAGLAMPGEHSPLHFPMTHDSEVLERYWQEAAQTVLTRLQQGQDVLFLVEGDASTYSTFGHLQRSVRALEPRVPVEVIPGVASFHAAAARCGEPLADVDDTVAIVPAGYGIEQIERMLNDFDTLVLLKVKPLLDDIIELLQRRDLLDYGYFIEKAGAPEERVVHDLASLRGQKVNYLSLMIIKNPGRRRGEMQRGCRKKKENTDA